MPSLLHLNSHQYPAFPAIRGERWVGWAFLDLNSSHPLNSVCGCPSPVDHHPSPMGSGKVGLSTCLPFQLTSHSSTSISVGFHMVRKRVLTVSNSSLFIPLGTNCRQVLVSLFYCSCLVLHK